MDLKHQLVIWKRASYLMDNVSLTDKLIECLVDMDVFSLDMMLQIQSKAYNTERTLTMLTLLGSYGEDIFQKFIEALRESNHRKVATELLKTEKYTQFGEMLPPSFTYFLDLSEFLMIYSHIAIKLGEHEKHIVQTFIEGKIEIENKKRAESIKMLEGERQQLLGTIDDLNNKLKGAIHDRDVAQKKLQEAQETNAVLKDKVVELEGINRSIKDDIVKLKHFRMQQDDLIGFIGEELKEFTGGSHQEGTTKATYDDRKRKVMVVSRENSKLRREGSRVQLGTRSPNRSILKEKSDLPTIDQSRENTMGNGPNVAQDEHSTLMNNKLLECQINLDVNKLDHALITMEQLEREEKKLVTVAKSKTINPKVAREAQKYLSEVKREKRALQEEFRHCEHVLVAKEKHLEEQGGRTAEEHMLDKNSMYDTLMGKLQVVIKSIKNDFEHKLKIKEAKHAKEIQEFILRIQKINEKHVADINRHKHRIRLKIFEINKREQLHRRIKNQIITIENYFSKNMNATISVEECRKIVRGIIGEARKLKAIADERDKEVPAWMLNEDGEQKIKPVKKKKKKKRRRLPACMADDKMQMIGGHIKGNWRAFGNLLEVTTNRMDMIEMDQPLHDTSKLAFEMLRVWRDEQKGKAFDLGQALIDIGREDLTRMLIPPHLMRKKKKVPTATLR